MKIKNIWLALFLLPGIMHLSYAQKSTYREKFVEGNRLLLEENYPMALKNFLEAYQIDSSNANINYKVGYCYLKSVSEKQKALDYFEVAANNTTHNYDEFDPSVKKAPEIVVYYLAQAYQLQYKFREASAFFSRFRDMVGSKNPELARDLDKQIQQGYTALEFLKNPVNVILTNLGDSINTTYADYSPLISADESVLIFTSRRQGSTGGEKTIDDQFYEDIYMSFKKADDSWSEALPVGQNINTNSNEGSISLSADGQQLFIYKDNNGGDIYYSTLDGDNWLTPVPMGSDINTEFWEPSGCLSPDGSTFYFVSDRKGGYGGRDLYRCVKLPNGLWSLALNLGPTVNSAYDEDAPFLHPDGITLFYSSKGHKNMGGFDVFYSVKNEEGKWANPVNLGAPINTPDDDIFYVLSTDGKRAYYSSVREGGYGEKDIYRITYVDAIVEPVTLLKGRLTFNGTEKIPSDVHITVTDLESGLVVQDVKPNSKTGKYVLTLSPGSQGKTYSISYDAAGYQPLVETLKIEPVSAYQEIEKGLELNPINFESKTLGTLSISGTITDKEGRTIAGAQIVIKNNTTGKLIDTYFISGASTGVYYFVLNRGENYNLSYEAKGYLFHSENINIPKQPEYTELKKDIVLEPIKAGAKIVLNNIFFDSNKSQLRKESTIEMEKLYNLMVENKELVMEISGHTDNKGKDELNIKLSQDRAQSVVNYLVKKGVDKNRLIAKGYGKKVPIAPNALPNGKPNPAGMQLNRRVELKVLEIR